MTMCEDCVKKKRLYCFLDEDRHGVVPTMPYIPGHLVCSPKFVLYADTETN